MINRTTARRLIESHIETPAVRLLAASGLSPNAVSVLGLLVAGGSAYLLSTGQLWAGGGVLLTAGLFDLMDGALARHLGRESRFGALLDSTLDRVSEAVVLVGLLVHYLETDSTEGVLLTYLALAGSVMVSYLRARAEGLGIECKVGIMTRPERVVALGVGLIVGNWWPVTVLAVLAAIAALTMVTSAQRLLHAWTTLGREE